MRGFVVRKCFFSVYARVKKNNTMSDQKVYPYVADHDKVKLLRRYLNTYKCNICILQLRSIRAAFCADKKRQHFYVCLTRALRQRMSIAVINRVA